MTKKFGRDPLCHSGLDPESIVINKSGLPRLT